jgi:hypothetical protein
MDAWHDASAAGYGLWCAMELTSEEGRLLGCLVEKQLSPAVLAVLLIFGAANNFGDPPTKASSTSHQSGVALGGTTSAQAAPASAPVKPSDRGWVLDSYRLSDHARGDFGGTVRITNTNKAAQSAVFTVFVLVKGREVASLQGFADGAAAGKTVTVHLTSQDKYQPGTYTIDFQSAVTRY